MKKAYLVSFVSTYGSDSMKFRSAVELIGPYLELGTVGIVKTAFIVFPDDIKTNAKQIRESLSENIHPFMDGVCVVRLDANDDSYLNYGEMEELIGQCRGPDDCQRNFSRFKTRHEGFEAYQLENPRWVYNDGLSVAIRLEFDEWLWLPIKKDGIYEKEKYDKYLR